ncbi:hypothetical protein HDV00_005761 [Rhizophlyctis rosea]|nr:hypothetical protein HDV00_005761 [Rhizophlyctis rosea]
MIPTNPYAMLAGLSAEDDRSNEVVNEGSDMDDSGASEHSDNEISGDDDYADCEEHVLDNSFDPSITKEIFLAHCTPITVTANPTEVSNPYYTAMVKSKLSAWSASSHFFGIAHEDYPHPVWCFSRFGQTTTTLPHEITTTPTSPNTIPFTLPTGTKILIAGEHEDSYDPDFQIYNDITLIFPDDTVQIYQYPTTSFPPTDFHTATLIDSKIYIIGNTGYTHDRKERVQVCILDLTTLKMEVVQDTCGDDPGWISSHEAEVDGEGTILIKVLEGTFCTNHGGCRVGHWVYHTEEARWEEVNDGDGGVVSREESPNR